VSKKWDCLKQIRLSPDNYKRLKTSQRTYPVPVTLGALANKAIEVGLPVLLQPGRTAGK
jgi:predicted ATP-grasp superfamily ATP-dependent carboligase